MMTEAATFAATIILMLIAAIHFYWAMGGSAGKAGAIPTIGATPIFAPTRHAAAAVGGASFLMAALVAATGGAAAPSAPALPIASALLALAFAARAVGDFRYVGFFKQVTGGAFTRRDSYLHSPLRLLIATLIGVVAIR